MVLGGGEKLTSFGGKLGPLGGGFPLDETLPLENWQHIYFFKWWNAKQPILLENQSRMKWWNVKHQSCSLYNRMKWWN